MTAPRPDPRVGTDLGPYRIEAVIGRGGMGVVYLAEQARLGRKVALKIVSPEFSDEPKARARFLRESQMAAAIDHPNILPIYEAGESDGVLFIAMRYVEGTDLAARLRDGPMEPRAAVALLAQVAAALDIAHARGLVHRDVKPANVLIDPGAGADATDHAYLTDFGLTKRGGSDSSLTAAGGFAGTLAYIAPEQVEGRELDGRSDQYSLAAMAFECLTGQVPFERESDIAVAMAHIRDPMPSAVAARPELPAAVDPVLARGLAKDPADRFPSCAAFVAALREALGVTVSHELAATTSGRSSAGGRDRPRWLLLAAAVAGLAVVALIAFALSAIDAPSASPSPVPSQAEASGSGAPSASVDTSPTADVFPNGAETALMAQLPDALASTCQRGPYGLVEANERAPGGTAKAPKASLLCRPLVSTGASELIIRTFDYGSGDHGFNTELAISNVARKVRAPGGDCATSRRANGRWQRSGEDAGAIVCYLDSTTGDAILDWSYPNARILVTARNQRGESTALYRFFSETARFIAP